MHGGDSVRLNERPIRISQVADITGYSQSHLYRLVREGRIPFHKNGRAGSKGAVRFYESEIDDWIKNGWVFSPAQTDLDAQADKILEGMK